MSQNNLAKDHIIRRLSIVTIALSPTIRP